MVIKYNVLVLFAVFTIIWCFNAYSEERQGEWSFSSLYGAMQPSVSLIEGGLFRVPLVGSGELKENAIGGSEEQPRSVDFRFDNYLIAAPFGGKSSFELQWHPNDKYSLLFGFGSWEKTTASKQLVKIPSQFVLNTVDYERRAKLTYTEFTIGGTMVFWRRPKYTFYARGSVHEVFDIDYREDMVFSYLSDNDLLGNERVRTMQAQTAGLVMAQIGLGAEWFFQKWISVGVEAGYLKSERNVQLRDIVRKDDFVSGDNLVFSGLPYGELSDGTLGYMAVDKDGNPLKQTVIVNGEETQETVYRRMRLDFSGWQVLFRVNIYY